ncbi:hypothetical protein NEOLEDRAFT_1138679 [Neolentinus lepideus HHB14362 ss-1]|uniref:NEDD8-activating enzyme E1 regulatory subunit n=1 Tax=Neolentinus lepideus HHB14362 ss-1 TaxID=1314782 RepID=A0A165Q4U7_9AGAM|nr:hypothetical protein NEOLEDRAFT_1138679 [Neolentinus lepideus HHB14362 ss-1]
MTSEPQDIETVTTAVATGQPDNKTRRYDRQLRLWAATGQAALESSRILVIGASATSTSIMKNLVLPGIGHFTILDHREVTPEDAGNNFFFEGQKSIGKRRADEAVRLLGELNDSVEGRADHGNVEEILNSNPDYFLQFSLVIAHNLQPALLDKLAKFLWSDSSHPTLMVVRSAGFVAEFFIQFHEHTIIESHSESAPSLRIDKPFPELYEHAVSLDFDNMDPTDHAHIPYVLILVRALEDWKKLHEGNPPKTYAEKQQFKKSIQGMKKKLDEENFDEAEAQAYRAWTETTIPSEISSLFQDPSLSSLTPSSPPFFHLLSALHKFTLEPPYTLPLTSTLPDMRSDTMNYIHLQTLYKRRAEEEKARFKSLISKDVKIHDEIVDLFVKNAHAVLVMKGKKWGGFDEDRVTLGNDIANAKAMDPSGKETAKVATHLVLSALSLLTLKNPSSTPTADALKAEVLCILGPDIELSEEQLDVAVGEVARAPTADLPNVAAFLGGMVAQEAIKMITKQYVPQRGYLVIDMIDMWTGSVGM